MIALLWVSLGLVAFTYVGYPLVLAALDAVREAAGGLRFLSGGPDRRAPGSDGPWPRLSVVLSAFDEEACIAEKIRNCLALDYPPDRLEILVGCDGCTDRTAALAREAGGGRVQVHELSPRSGKANVLSRVVPLASGDLVLLTDANTMLEPGAAKALARRFRDPSCGAAVGRLRLVDPEQGAIAESAYWKYETALKYWEGKSGCVIGANGGLYAIRRLLWSPLLPDTIVDDLVVPLRIAARGWRVRFEPDAVAVEEVASGAGEFERRARIGAGDWQALTRSPDVLDPRNGFLFFAFVSHKLLRWATPLLLAAALLASLAAAAQPGAWGYRALFLAEVGFLALALAGRRGAGGRLGAIAHHFVAMNAALAVGFWRFVRGTQRAAWDRTARLGGAGARAA